MPAIDRILGDKLITEICKQLNIPEHDVVRIVVDASFSQTVKVYVETLGTKGLLRVNWAADLADTEVKFAPTNEPELAPGEMDRYGLPSDTAAKIRRLVEEMNAAGLNTSYHELAGYVAETFRRNLLKSRKGKGNG